MSSCIDKLMENVGLPLELNMAPDLMNLIYSRIPSTTNDQSKMNVWILKRIVALYLYNECGGKNESYIRKYDLDFNLMGSITSQLITRFDIILFFQAWLHFQRNLPLSETGIISELILSSIEYGNLTLTRYFLLQFRDDGSRQS